jgi:hypothetical protein
VWVEIVLLCVIAGIALTAVLFFCIRALLRLAEGDE